MMRIERSLREVEVLALELQPPLVLEAATTVAGVIQEMRNHYLGYALITVDNRLAGIFTERDVFLSVLGNDAVLDEPVFEHMTPDPVCVGTKDPIRKVVLLMHQSGHRQIPITDTDGHIAGCVRHKEIAEYMVNHFAKHVLNLPPDPEQIAQAPEGG
jgi:CBS domain-containing protein